MSNQQPERKSIGALWEKTSGRGANFLTGEVEIDGKKIKLVCFKNGYKEQEKHPDWRIYLSEQQASGFVPSTFQKPPRPAATPKAVAPVVDDGIPLDDAPAPIRTIGNTGIEYPDDDIRVEDIPF